MALRIRETLRQLCKLIEGSSGWLFLEMDGICTMHMLMTGWTCGFSQSQLQSEHLHTMGVALIVVYEGAYPTLQFITYQSHMVETSTFLIVWRYQCSLAA